MNCNISKHTVYSCKTVLENFSEEKVDIDIVIPDYCLAAVRILKCEVIPTVNSKVLDNDRLIIDGTCKVNILYIDEENANIRSISESTPFSQTLGISEEFSSYKVKIKLRTSSVSCRLQNSRRISVKAIVGVAVKVMGNFGTEIIDSIDDCSVETMYEHFHCYMFKDSGEADSRIIGELAPEDTVNEIVKSEANICITEIKPINDKLIIKGKAFVSCLYTSGDEVLDFNSISGYIPFSEVVDVIDTDENSICDVECDVINIRCDIGNQTQDNMINVEIDAKINASVYGKTDIKLLKDVYSREHDLYLKRKEIVIESMREQLKFTEIVNDNIKIELPDARIADVMSKPVIKNVTAKENSLIIEGDVYASVYAQNGEEYRIIDRVFPFAISKELKNMPLYMRCEATSSVVDTNFSMPDYENVDIKSEIEFSVFLFSKETYDIVDELEADYENTPESLDTKIVLYYADKGERLWDIAKKYYSSVDIIKRDNDISENTVTDSRMLLISRN